MKTQITVTWSAFDNRIVLTDLKPSQSVSIELDLPAGMFDYEICDLLFADTNCYQGLTWNAINAAGLPESRTHTALSVGDTVRIQRNRDNSLYRCEDTGWELLTFSLDGIEA